MKTSKKDITTVGNAIAEMLNTYNHTNIYSFDPAWGVIKRSKLGGIDIVVNVSRWDSATYEKLIAVREVIYEVMFDDYDNSGNDIGQGAYFDA